MQTLNERLLRDYRAENYPIGLANGKMGGIVYLYHLHRYTGQDTYSETAGNLLDQLLESGMSVHDNLTVMDGLCGIGLGLEHLVTDQFIEGDLNELLNEIDDRLFKTVAFEEHSSLLLSDSLMNGFFYSISNKLECVTNLSNRLKKDLNFNNRRIKVLNTEYQNNREIIKSLFDKTYDSEFVYQLIELINRRSFGLEGCVKNIIETANAYKLDTKQYLPSYLHLTHNRLFSSDSNLYELVIYDFLKKEYQRQLHL